MTNTQEAVYVLNRRVYQESSLIVDLFCLRHGKVSLIAKGALKSRSDKAALLQPFQALNVSWVGKSDLKTLSSVELAGPVSKLHSTFLFCAYYINELLQYLLPQIEISPKLFGHYIQVLDELSRQCEQHAVLRVFEFILLSELGDLPDFEYDINNEAIRPDFYYGVMPKQGFVQTGLMTNKHEGFLTISGASIKALKLSCDSESFIKRLKEQSYEFKLPEKELVTDTKLLMNYFIKDALKGKELKSRDMFRSAKYM